MSGGAGGTYGVYDVFVSLPPVGSLVSCWGGSRHSKKASVGLLIGSLPERSEALVIIKGKLRRPHPCAVKLLVLP